MSQAGWGPPAGSPTIKYKRGAAGIGLGTTIKYLRRTTSGAADNGLGTTIKYLRRTTSGAMGNYVNAKDY